MLFRSIGKRPEEGDKSTEIRIICAKFRKSQLPWNVIKELDLPKIDSGDSLERSFFDDRLNGNANYVKISASRIIQENKEKKIMLACFASSSKEDVSVCESRANRSV